MCYGVLDKSLFNAKKKQSYLRESLKTASRKARHVRNFINLPDKADGPQHELKSGFPLSLFTDFADS